MKGQATAEGVLDALGDPTRRRVLTFLGQTDGLTPTQLAQRLPVSRQAVSKHLQILGRAGLVTAQRRGRETAYSLCSAPLTEAMSWMAQVGSEWDSRLEALKQQLS